MTANFAAFEIDDEVLPNLREYALANSLYWVCLEHYLFASNVNLSLYRLSRKVTHANNQLVEMPWM